MKPIEKASNNIAKLEALKEGLKLSLKHGIQKLIIEGDSQIILNALRKLSTPNWCINSKLEMVFPLLYLFEEIRFQHIYREGNKEVGLLANIGVNRIDSTIEP